MAAWIPAIKLVLPHVATIVSAAIPAFTRWRAAPDGPLPATELQQQITELQNAATVNAEHIRELAGRLQDTIEALQQGADLAQRKVQRAHTLALVACGGALVSLMVALAALAST